MKFFLILLACTADVSALTYTGYIGDAFTYQVSAMTTDAAGNTYVTGSRTIAANPGYFLPPLTDVFVVKVDPSGNPTLLATLSGKGTDSGAGIAVDASGNIYVVGTTTSTDFPLLHPIQSTNGPFQTGFLTKLSPDGSILYSTYLGGTMGQSTLNAVATDSNGDAFVTGQSSSSDYPHTPGLPSDPVSGNEFNGLDSISGAFFAKISPAGDKILYAGLLAAAEHACSGGSPCLDSAINTSGSSIAVDPAGNAYIAGNTGGLGLPTTPGALVTQGVGAFAAKINAAGTGLVYLTLLGGANYGLDYGAIPGNTASAIAADSNGNAYLTGWTSDPNFPATEGAVQPKLDGQSSDPFSGPPPDAFVAKINPTGTAMVWATFLGGSSADQGQTVALDPSGNVWTSGITQSADFPVVSGYPGGGEFLSELNSSGSALLYSSTLPVNSAAAALAIDSMGNVHYAGGTGILSEFPPGEAPGQTAVPALFGITNAAGSALAGRISPGEVISLYGLNLGPVTPSTASFNQAGFLPTSLAGVQVSVNGTFLPLLYVSASQINAVIPFELAAPSVAGVTVTQNGVATPRFRAVVDSATPEVFHDGGPGDAALVINEDGSVNSSTNPAKVGSYVSIWATGVGNWAGLTDGEVASSAYGNCICQITEQGGVYNGLIPYAGAAPGTVNGIVQVNFQVTPEIADGSILYLTVNGFTSDPFFFYATQ